MKRIVDVVFALVGIVVLSPLLLLISVLIRLTDDGPVLFRQERIGRRFRPFQIFKFRTMVVGAEAQGGLTVGEDRRVTRLGQVLRQSKLDELPQLFNVLRGDMSLVGPRPELRKYVEMFRKEYRPVLHVRPGITDVASIAYRDESHLLGQVADPEQHYVRTILPDKIRLAREYVMKGSVLYDLWLIVKTVMILVYPKPAVDRVVEVLDRFHLVIAGALQLAAVVVAHHLSVWLRFEGSVPPRDAALLSATLPLLVALRLAWFQPFGLYRGMWRYVGTRDVQNIVSAVALSSVSFWAVLTVVLGIGNYPRSILIMDAVFCIALVLGLRVARRIQHHLRKDYAYTKKVLLVGTSDATERLLRGIVNDRRSDYEVIGLVDTDPRKKGMTIHNVPILGSEGNLEEIIAAKDPDEILLAESPSCEDTRRRVTLQATRYEKPVKTIPPIGGQNGHAHGEIRPDDLLFREPMKADWATLETFFRGKRVLITGAGGSIGSEICRQIARCQPASLVLFEKHEASLYHVDKELRNAFPGGPLRPVVGDVTDRGRVDEVLSDERPDVVFHAAAYKHVPMMELNPGEAFKTNLFGTKLVAEAALRHGVGIFVLISTDKAVEPVSVMGLSKRGAELSIQALSGTGETRFMAVRFGNVLESSGSVIPLFREQIERGGPVTVTHPEVTRLFMTVPEAVQLIMHAATIGKGGEVFVLDMGKPIRILDMAEALIRLYGFTPYRDIDIVFTGLRPGERLFEKLFNDHESVWKTSNDKILMAVNGVGTPHGRRELRRILATVEEHLRNGHVEDLRRALKETLA